MQSVFVEITKLIASKHYFCKEFFCNNFGRGGRALILEHGSSLGRTARGSCNNTLL